MKLLFSLIAAFLPLAPGLEVDTGGKAFRTLFGAQEVISLPRTHNPTHHVLLQTSSDPLGALPSPLLDASPADYSAARRILLLTKRASPGERGPDESSGPSDDSARDAAAQPSQQAPKTKKKQKKQPKQPAPKQRQAKQRGASTPTEPTDAQRQARPPPNPAAAAAADAADDISAAATPSAARRKPGRPVGSGELPADTALQRQRQHSRTYQRNLALRAASRDPSVRERAQSTLAKMKASKGRTARIVAQHYTRARAAEALHRAPPAALPPEQQLRLDGAVVDAGGVSEWAMWQRLALCKREYHAAVTKLKQLDLAPRQRDLRGKGGGGGGGGGGGDGDGGGGSGGGGAVSGGGKAGGKFESGGTADPVLMSLSARALAAYNDEWTRRWVRGKQCMRMLYVVGQEVARRKGALGEPGAPPAPAWTELRRAWPSIERRWDELGDDESMLDDIMAAVARDWQRRRGSESGGGNAAGSPAANSGSSSGGGGKGKRKSSRDKGTRLFGGKANEVVMDAAEGLASAAASALRRTKDEVAAIPQRLGGVAKDAAPLVKNFSLRKPSLYPSSPAYPLPIMPLLGGQVVTIH
jgi:uncharacterized membrane protein YgcG